MYKKLNWLDSVVLDLGSRSPYVVTTSDIKRVYRCMYVNVMCLILLSPSTPVLKNINEYEYDITNTSYEIKMRIRS